MFRLVVFLILLQHAHSVCMVAPDVNGHVSAQMLSNAGVTTTIGTTKDGYSDFHNQYFYECTTLKSIDIPASVDTIGYYAFYYSYVANVSYNGTDMSLLQLQDELGTRAYDSGADTTGVTVYYGSDRSFSGTPYTDCPLADKTASHGIYTGNSMRYCKWLTSVTIPSSVTSIGYQAFYKTTYLKSVDFSGATNLKTIGSWAFGYATALTSVDFSGATNLTEIGSYAFATTALTSIDLRQATKLRTIGINAFYYFRLSGFLFLPATFFDVDGASTMLYDAIKEANNIRHCMVTPDSNGHVNATALSANLINNSLGLGSRFRYVTGFYKCNTLKSIEIPATVTSIGASAFYGTDLTSVDFSNATALKTIGAYAFYQSTALTSVTIPSSVSGIGDYAFSYTALTSIDFSGATALETIGASAFEATALTSVTIPSSVTSIGGEAFYYNNLATVIIPESVETIGGTGLGYGAFGYNDITELAILGTPTFYEYTSFSYSYHTFRRKSGGSLQLKRFCGSYSALPSNIKAQISMTHAVTDCTFWCAPDRDIMQISTNYNCTTQWSTSCAAGSYFTPKPAGMQVAMSDTCTPCPAGTFQSIPGSNATSCTHFTTGNDRRLIAVGTRTADYVWGDVPILGPSALKTAWSNMNCSGGQMYQREPGNCTVGRICFTDGDVLECPTDAVRLNATHCSSRKSDVHNTLERFCPL